MKKLLLLAVLLAPLVGVVPAQAAADNGVAVLAYSADQLAAKFVGKNRKDIVSAISTIPVYEKTFTASDGTEYEAVRYGKTNEEYRLFLFKFKWPQPLVAVVENANGIMTLNERYQINIPVTQKDVAAHAPAGAALTTVTDVANNATYQVYQNENQFMVFQNGLLVHTFDNAQDYSAFMATITASNSSYAAEQAQEQTNLEAARLAQAQNNTQYVTTRSYVVPTVVGTAVLGGVVWGSIYHHNHHRQHYRPAPPPPHRHGGPGAHRPGPGPRQSGGGLAPGTPLIRGADGRFMNHPKR